MQVAHCDKCNGTITIGMKRFKSRTQANYDLCEKCVPEENREKLFFELMNLVDEDVRHEYISCNKCGTDPIWGNRFECQTCHNFDLCEGISADIQLVMINI